MTALATLALGALPDERPADAAGRFSRPRGWCRGSAFLFRGPVGLQSVVTLGEGDILDQKGKLFGASGTYEDP